MDMRSAASRAPRERHENRSEPPARAAAVAAIKSTAFPALPLRLLYPLSRQFTRHTMSSKFHPNSLKTKDWCTRKVTHLSEVGRGTLATDRGFLIDTLAI